MQERICNLCRVSFIVSNRMQGMKNILTYLISSTICILRVKLLSPADELKNVIKVSSILKMRAG